MRHIIPFLGVFLSLVAPTPSHAQRDRCHVFVVDVAAAQKAPAIDDEQTMVKAAQAAQTIFPEFSLTPSEESLTTKHFRFPGTKHVITASVYYTDESMESSVGRDSIVLGVTLADREVSDAISQQAADSSVAEASYSDHTGKVRTKRYVTVNSKVYLIGLECDCSRAAPARP